jgi:hypothetical protein
MDMMLLAFQQSGQTEHGGTLRTLTNVVVKASLGGFVTSC